MNGQAIVTLCILGLKALKRRSDALAAGRETELTSGLKSAINQLEALLKTPALKNVEIQDQDIQL